MYIHWLLSWVNHQYNFLVMTICDCRACEHHFKKCVIQLAYGLI